MNQLHEYENTAQEHTELLSTYSSQIASLEEQLSEKRREAEAFATKLTTTEEELCRRDDMIKSLKEEAKQSKLNAKHEIEKRADENQVLREREQARGRSRKASVERRAVREQLQKGEENSGIEMQSLVNEIDHLRMQLHETERSAGRKVQVITAEADSLKMEMNRKQQIWERSVQTLTADYTKIRALENSHRQTIQGLTEELEILRAEKLKDEKKIRRLLKKKTELEAMVEKCNLLTAVDLVTQTSNANRLVFQLENNLAARTSENEALAKKVAQLKALVSDLKDANAQLKLAAANASADSEDLRQQLAKMVSESEYSAQKDAMTRSSSRSVDSSGDELSQSRTNNEFLLSRIRELEQSDSYRELALLQSANKELEARLEALAQKLSERERTDGRKRRAQRSGRALSAEETTQKDYRQHLSLCLTTLRELLSSVSVFEDQDLMRTTRLLIRKLEDLCVKQGKPK
jgi:chromosome segregation ATPase